MTRRAPSGFNLARAPRILLNTLSSLAAVAVGLTRLAVAGLVAIARLFQGSPLAAEPLLRHHWF
jgi:hypothetical protein